LQQSFYLEQKNKKQKNRALLFMKKSSNSTGEVLMHSFAIDVKGGEKKNIAINNKGGDC